MLQAGDRIGDWIVVDVLGEGGMGAVFRCHNAMSDRIQAAVKVVKPHSLQDEQERFIREVEALDALRHPAVVGIKGWGLDGERELLWLAMDLVQGEDLERHLAKGPLEPEAARRVFAAVADALRHAHAKGIFHRDIKPANIIISDDGHPWIVDFGIAVQKGRTRLTAMGTVPGTPAYMAPEIFSGEVRPDPVKLDVYALGQVLWEALRGDHAFPEDSDTLSTGQALVQLMGRKLRADPLDPGPRFPDDLRAAIRAATEPEPDDRVADMDGLYRLLTGGGGPVSGGATLAPPEGSGASIPPPPSTGGAAPRRRRRWPLLIGGSLAAAAAVLAFLGVVGVAAIGAWLGLPGGDTPPPSRPDTVRDVQVVLTGLADGTPAVVTLDGAHAEGREGMRFPFTGVAPGPHEVWVATGACDVAEVGTCAGCCGCVTETVVVEPGQGVQTLALSAAPPPESTPRPVRIAAPEVGAPWNVFIDLGGASGPVGARVDRNTKDYASVAPGTYSLRIEAGRCPTSARGCWPDGDCPAGCTSFVTELEVPCGTERFDFATPLATPEGVAAVPAPAEVSCRRTCPDGAYRGTIPAGQRVTVIALHEEDAYCGYPGAVGVTGSVVGELQVNDACWLGGGIRGDDGVEYYFFKAAFEEVRSAPRPSPSGARFEGSSLPAGTSVEIVDVHPADAFYANRDTLKGLRCETTGVLEAMEPGWLAGPMFCAGPGTELYFFKVAVRR